jgi:quinol monooxygenase YgiN
MLRAGLNSRFKEHSKSTCDFQRPTVRWLAMLTRIRFLLIALTAGAVSTFAQAPQAPPADPNLPLYVVTHVDIGGQAAAVTAAKLLSEFAADSRKEAGSIRFEVYREVGRANHFTVVEVWQNRAAFEQHLGGSVSKSFREKIQPLLGSPFDERLHNLLQ